MFSNKLGARKFGSLVALNSMKVSVHYIHPLLLRAISLRKLQQQKDQFHPTVSCRVDPQLNFTHQQVLVHLSVPCRLHPPAQAFPLIKMHDLKPVVVQAEKYQISAISAMTTKALPEAFPATMTRTSLMTVGALLFPRHVRLKIFPTNSFYPMTP